jgi:hypothetical protein
MLKTTKYHKIGPFFTDIIFITQFDHFNNIKYCYFDNNYNFYY